MRGARPSRHARAIQPEPVPVIFAPVPFSVHRWRIPAECWYPSMSCGGGITGDSRSTMNQRTAWRSDDQTMEASVTRERPEAAPLHAVEVLGVLGVWTFYAALNVVTGTLNHRRGGGGGGGVQSRVEWGHLVLSVVWAVLTLLVLWLSRYFLLDRAFWRRRALYVIAFGVVVAIASDTLCDVIWDAVLPHEMARGGRGAERHFRPGVRNLTWFDDFGVFAAAVAVGAARGYMLRERARRELARRRETELEARSAHAQAEAASVQADAARLQSQLSEARLDALQRQLDPHFLFNTLNAVSALVERDPRGVRRMIGQLSDLLRHSMNSASAPEIPFRQELELLERYVDIMRVRFEELLLVEIEVDPRVLNALVPNLILQPLVENAIKHGVEQRANGGRVHIAASLDGDTVVLRVRDDGPDDASRAMPSDSTTGAPTGNGVGLRNTTARLEQLYGDAQSLTLGRDDLGGMVAEVRLPYHARPLPRDHAARATPTDPLRRDSVDDRAEGLTAEPTDD